MKRVSAISPSDCPAAISRRTSSSRGLTVDPRPAIRAVQRRDRQPEQRGPRSTGGAARLRARPRSRGPSPGCPEHDFDPDAPRARPDPPASVRMPSGTARGGRPTPRPLWPTDPGLTRLRPAAIPPRRSPGMPAPERRRRADESLTSSASDRIRASSDAAFLRASRRSDPAPLARARSARSASARSPRMQIWPISMSLGCGWSPRIVTAVRIDSRTDSGSPRQSANSATPTNASCARFSTFSGSIAGSAAGCRRDVSTQGLER